MDDGCLLHLLPKQRSKSDAVKDVDDLRAKMEEAHGEMARLQVCLY